MIESSLGPIQRNSYITRNTAFIAIAAILLLSGSVAAQTTGQELSQKYRQTYDFISMEDTIYTFESEFLLPVDFHYPDSGELTPFQNWIANVPIWHRHKPIGLWKGSKMYEADEVSRAVHIPWKGPPYTEASFPLRFLGEYARYLHRETAFTFQPIKGERLKYTAWLSGKPAYSNKGAPIFLPADSREANDAEFYKMLHFCMHNNNYRSLAANCAPVTNSNIAPGDMFIAYDSLGHNGHALLVLNRIEDEKGHRLYAVGQGCPEACDFHIPKVHDNRDNPWLTVREIKDKGKQLAFSGFYRFRLIDSLTAGQ